MRFAWTVRFSSGWSGCESMAMHSLCRRANQRSANAFPLADATAQRREGAATRWRTHTTIPHLETLPHQMHIGTF
eukprot:1452327-Pleurochrysis_carterae.AAC.1